MQPDYPATPFAPEIVQVPRLQFAMIDGTGNPNNSPDFQNAIQALYGVAYGIKFGRKKQQKGADFKVMPLEGLWWTKDGEDFKTTQIGEWFWTLMLQLPDDVSPAEFKEQLEALKKKKANPAINSLRLESFEEGEVVQVLHIGPYGKEQPVIEHMHAFARQQGYDLSGKHHEIYLGDPRRAAPDKLKTVLRQPVTHMV